MQLCDEQRALEWRRPRVELADRGVHHLRRAQPPPRGRGAPMQHTLNDRPSWSVLKMMKWFVTVSFPLIP